MSFHWQIFTLNKSNFATDEGTTAHLLCVVGWGGGENKLMDQGAKKLNIKTCPSLVWVYILKR